MTRYRVRTDHGVESWTKIPTESKSFTFIMINPKRGGGF